MVTGAGHGIGRAIALRFAAEGAQVIVNDIDDATVEEVVKEIMTNGGLAIPGVADVSNKGQVDSLFDRVLERFGALDGQVLNNIGVLAAAVIALAGIPLGILVGKDTAHRLQHGFAHKILRGNQL